ncbi:MAG: HD domain-containing protein [candidate division Zixibacteria bacterium]|nr:HD domain-containing protein [candidate division Zixibacteria bacterium]
MFDLNENKYEMQVQELEKKFQDLGLKIFRSLYSTLKTAAIYDANNNRYIAKVSELRHLMAEIFTEEDNLSFAYKDSYFFINTFRLTLETSDQESVEFFTDRFKALNIEGFSIYSRADNVEIDKFIFSLSNFKASEDPLEAYQYFRYKLEDLRIQNIVLIKMVERKDSDKEETEKSNKTTKIKARKVFFKSISIVHEIISQANSGGKLNLTKTKRLVQSMVDNIIEDEAALMELTVLRNFDNYTYMHSVNVCIYSLVLGCHINLDKRRLTDLGVSALLHDIGKINLPGNLINKTEKFDEMDWQQIRMHPIYGAKAITKTRGTDRSSVRAIATAYEHHITYSGGGYPQLLQKRIPCLFAQIVAVADSFDAMCSGRVYHKKKRKADEVITNMINRVKTDFNPLLLKVFINAIGIYPIGSVVRLNNDEVAIVSRNNPDNLEKPEVKIIANRDGAKADVKIIDLSSEEASMIRIQNIIDGDKYNIDPANYIDLGE